MEKKFFFSRHCLSAEFGGQWMEELLESLRSSEVTAVRLKRNSTLLQPLTYMSNNSFSV